MNAEIAAFHFVTNLRTFVCNIFKSQIAWVSRNDKYQVCQVAVELSPDKLPIPKMIASKDKIPAAAPKQTVQIVKIAGSGGKYQVHGLLPGQKLVRMSNGKLCIFSSGNVPDEEPSSNTITTVAKPTACALDPNRTKKTSSSDDVPSSAPEKDFSNIEMSSPKTITSPSSEPMNITPVNESAVLEDSKEMLGDSKEMLGDSKVVVKKEELDCNAGVNENAVESPKPENQIGEIPTMEWNDLRKYATVAQKGTHGSGKKTVLQCSLCGKIMSHGNIAVMMIHIESMHFRGFFNHTCPVCEKTFETKTLVTQHKHKEHKN